MPFNYSISARIQLTTLLQFLAEDQHKVASRLCHGSRIAHFCLSIYPTPDRKADTAMTASSQDNSMKAITSDFWSRIPRAGFPQDKQQSQKWKDLGLPQPTLRKDAEDDKNVVIVSMRHDYGEPHCSFVSIL